MQEKLYNTMYYIGVYTNDRKFIFNRVTRVIKAIEASRRPWRANSSQVEYSKAHLVHQDRLVSIQMR